MNLFTRLFLAPLLFVLVGPLSPEEPFFPLEPGNFWRYVSNDPGRQGVFQEIVVLKRESNLVWVRFQWRVPGLPGVDPLVAEDLWLQDRGDEIDLLLEGEGLVPYYRFAEDSWEHRDTDICDDGMEVRVYERDVISDTPAGRFTSCLAIGFRRRACADGGTLGEHWCRGVGLVQWSEITGFGGQTWSLEEHRFSPLFRRGDANQDGRVDLSDAVDTLGHLFLGTRGPSCADAADSNDDGRLDLSDAIETLSFLFLGGSALPYPGAGRCGGDPGEDALGCDASPSCAP